MLDKIKSKIRIQQDIKQLEKTLSMKINASLNKNNSRAKITRDLKQISTGQEIRVKARVDRKSLQSSLNSARQQVENSSISQPVNISSRVNVNSNSLNQANQAQNELINGGGRIRDVVQYYVNWQKVLDLIVQSARKAVDASVELAKAQTNLQIVTGKSNEQMQLLMRDYNKLAQDLSSTTLNVTNAADQWLRQGKSVAETNELIKDSVILSKIGQLEESEATKYLTSAMNGYKVATEDVIGVVDKLSAVDLASATSAGGLAESMSKTANSAKIAGVSMDNLIGYIATVTDVTQKSASVVGESFKTIFSRMGKVSIGDFIDDDGTDMTEQINQVEGILGKFDIKLRESADEFRNFEDVIYDVGIAWDNFTSVEKNAIAAGFGGVYQRENVLTLFENFDKAMKLSEVSANSAGTSLQKFATYENGLEAATNRLTASFESLAYNTVNSDFMIGLADGAAAIVDFVDKTKLIQAGLTALTFTGIIKGLLMFNTKMVAVKNNMNAMTTAMNLSTKTTQRTRAENVLLGQSYAKLTPAQQRLLLSNKKLNMEQKIAILRASGLTRAQARTKLQAMGLATATNTAANATFSLRGAWETLKLSIASNPIGLIVTVLTSASMIISTAIEKQKELEEAAKAAAEEARNEADEIKDLYSEYSKLSEEIQKDASRKDELSTVTDNLLKKLGYEKSAVENLTKEYGDLDTAIKSVTLEGLQDKWDNLLVDYGTKKKALTDLLPGKTLIDGNRVLNVRNDKGLNDYEDTIQMLEKSGLFDEILRPYANETGADLNISFILPDGLEDVEGMKRYYNIVSKAIQILNQEYSSEMLIDNAVYQKFVSIQTEIRNKMDEFGVSVNSANENLAMQQILTSEIANGVPKTAEGFKKYREALIESALSNDQFVGTEEDIESAINSSLRSMPEFAEFFEAELPEAIDNSIPSVQKLTDAYEDLEEQIEKILDLQSKLSDAFEKVASGEVFTAEEAYNLVKEIPELYKFITPVESGFSFSLDGLESAYKAQNEELIKQIKENSKENQKVIDYYNEQKNKLDGLQSDTTASTGIRGFNALEADTKTSGYSENMTDLKQSADEASEIIKQNNALINCICHDIYK